MTCQFTSSASFILRPESEQKQIKLQKINNCVSMQIMNDGSKSTNKEKKQQKKSTFEKKIPENVERKTQTIFHWRKWLELSHPIVTETTKYSPLVFVEYYITDGLTIKCCMICLMRFDWVQLTGLTIWLALLPV